MEHYDESTRIRFSGKGDRSSRRRALAAAAAAVALAGAGVGVLEQPGVAQPSDRTTATAERVVELVNAERAKVGCAAVTVDSQAQAAAQAHADDMAARNYYDHNSPEGADAGDRLNAAGYTWQKWAENIHKGPSAPEQAMRDWMNSDGHRANILDCGLHDLGVGVNSSANGPWWVQVFATKRG